MDEFAFAEYEDVEVATRLGNAYLMLVESPHAEVPAFRASLWEPDPADPGMVKVVRVRTFASQDAAIAWCERKEARHIARLHDEIAEFLAVA